MNLLTLILLALAGGIHWLRCNPNRDGRGRYKPNNVAERFGVYVVLALIALLVLAGCSKPSTFAGPSVPPPNQATDKPLNKAAASADSIDGLNAQAKPESNDKGKAILGAQDEEIDRLKAHIAEATAKNEEASKEWNKREGEYRKALEGSQRDANNWKAAYDTVTSEWGYRFQVWVEWAWFWIKCYLAICTVLFFLRFVPGAVGAFAALAFSVLWIPGWANAFADNAFFRGWVPWMRKGDSK